VHDRYHLFYNNIASLTKFYVDKRNTNQTFDIEMKCLYEHFLEYVIQKEKDVAMRLKDKQLYPELAEFRN
jgi:hypothetical protein